MAHTTEIHITNSFLTGSHSANEGLPSYVPYANRKNENNKTKTTTISSPSPSPSSPWSSLQAQSTTTRTNVNVAVTQPDPNPSNNSIVCSKCCNEWTKKDKQKPNSANGDDYDNSHQPSVKQWCSNYNTSNCNNSNSNTSTSSSASASSSSNSSLSMSEYDECGDNSTATTATTDFASNRTLTQAESFVCNCRSCIDDVTSYCAYSASDGIHVTTTNTCTKCHCTDSPSSVSRTQICAKIGASDKDACATNVPIHARIAVTHTICQEKSKSSIDDDNSRTEAACVCVNDEGNTTTTIATTSTVPFTAAAEPVDTVTTVRISAADDPRIIKKDLVAAAAAETLSDENKNFVVIHKDTKPIRRATDSTTSEKSSQNCEKERKDAERIVKIDDEVIEKHRRHSHLSHRRLRNAAAIRQKLLVKSAVKNINQKSKKCKHSRRRCRCVLNLCDGNGIENDVNNWRRSSQHLKKVKTKKSVDDDINEQNKQRERVIKTSSTSKGSKSSIAIERKDESLRRSEKNHRRAHRYNQFDSGTGNNISSSSSSRQSSSIVTLNNSLNTQQDDSATNGDHFESSNRLRRLEERFKDIAITKKIVQESKDDNNCQTAAPVQRGDNEDVTEFSALADGRTLSVVDTDNDSDNGLKCSLGANSDSNNNHIDARLQHHKSDVDPFLASGVVEHKENRGARHTFSLISNDVDHITAAADESEKQKRHSCCEHVTVRNQKNNRKASEQRRAADVSIVHEKLPLSSLSCALDETKTTNATNVECAEAFGKQKFRQDKTVPVTIDIDNVIREIGDANKHKINVDEQIRRCSSDRGSLKADLPLPKETDNVNLTNKSHSSSSTTTSTPSTNEDTTNEDIFRIDLAKQTTTTNNNLERINGNRDDVTHKLRPADDDANGNCNLNQRSESVDADNVHLIDCTTKSISAAATTDPDEIRSLFLDAHDTYASHLIYGDHNEDDDDDDGDETIDETSSSLPTNCAFDVRDLAAFGSHFNGIYECYDELESPSSAEYEFDGCHHEHGPTTINCDPNNDNDNENDDHDHDHDDDDHIEYKNENDSDTCELKVPNVPNANCANRIKFSGKYCECTVEAEIIPVYRAHGAHYRRRSTIMRDMSSSSSTTSTTATANSGTLRGLLKKPNRPPPLQKNRVIFDETRNEFFDADYIILIRDDCPYDEEDEEPCTCGEHELVRLCCDEGCQCTAYADDTRTPQVNELHAHTHTHTHTNLLHDSFQL